MGPFESFLNLKINSIKLDDEDKKEILKWFAKNNLTYYNGAYVIASKNVGGIPLTADDLLYEKARKEILIVHFMKNNVIGATSLMYV